jgi:hypothetical protein
MFRKLALAAVAAASLGATALIPTAASAHGFGWGHHGWGWGHRHFGGPALFVGGYDDGCYQQRVVETRRGPRVRIVNVCAF